MVEAEMLDAAMAQAEAQLAAGHSVVLVAGSQWHPGVVGIVAGRIKERFNRPACVAALADGMAKGSGRSVAGIDLGAAIIAARAHGLLSSGGGHAMAAGFGLPEPGLATFHAFLDERLAAAALLPSAAELVIEGGLAVPGCTLELARDIARLAPFGPGNAEPVLVLASVRVAHAERIGKEGATIRAQLEGEAGGRVKALLFRAEGRLAETLLGRPDARLDMAGHLRAETWNGRESVSFMIRDATMTQPA
jgi:single-stranded-DNA-specific exonuclease